MRNSGTVPESSDSFSKTIAQPCGPARRRWWKAPTERPSWKHHRMALRDGDKLISATEATLRAPPDRGSRLLLCVERCSWGSWAIRTGGQMCTLRRSTTSIFGYYKCPSLRNVAGFRLLYGLLPLCLQLTTHPYGWFFRSGRYWLGLTFFRKPRGPMCLWRIMLSRWRHALLRRKSHRYRRSICARSSLNFVYAIRHLNADGLSGLQRPLHCSQGGCLGDCAGQIGCHMHLDTKAFLRAI